MYCNKLMRQDNEFVRGAAATPRALSWLEVMTILVYTYTLQLQYLGVLLCIGGECDSR